VNTTQQQLTSTRHPSSGSVIEATDRFLTLSNFLSVLRAVLVIPFVMVMSSTDPMARWWGGALLAVAALTDKLDGMLARKYNQVTEWGRILDPLADKIGVAAVVLVLFTLKALPFWFVALVLGRDVLIFAGGVFLKATRGVVLPSNETGKWAVGIITLTIFLLVLGVHSVVTETLLYVSTFMLLISFALYLMRFWEIEKQKN
jgi:CDP-diacylglycerol--glycerol-3-phosphate 3-phosphatidyltransferase